MQVTTAHDQRYSTFKMAAEVKEKKQPYIRDLKKAKKKNKNKNMFSRVCEQVKVTTQGKKKEKKRQHPIVSCSVISTLPISHHK